MKTFSAFTFILAAFVVVALFSSNTRNESGPQASENSTINKENAPLPQVIHGVDLKPGINLAGEEVPLNNFDAKERLEREFLVNSYWHSSTVLYLKNANRYFPVIEPILAEEGVPDDFKYLAVAESAMRNAKSPAGASGVWQFMKDPARNYGLEVNSEIDERYHLEKSTRAACKYLKESKRQFGSWTMAAASYNMGGPRLKKLIENQKESNYYNLHMNAETARYVFRIIAIKTIMTQPEQFGFYIEQDELYQPLDNTYSVEVSGEIESWADFAKEKGTTYRMLKVYNPWLREPFLKNKSAKKYIVKIPRS
ncbi:MAG: lytic transglycosylase domain-containing protein [Bacteroidota bacterium]